MASTNLNYDLMKHRELTAELTRRGCQGYRSGGNTSASLRAALEADDTENVLATRRQRFRASHPHPYDFGRGVSDRLLQSDYESMSGETLRSQFELDDIKALEAELHRAEWENPLVYLRGTSRGTGWGTATLPNPLEEVQRQDEEKELGKKQVRSVPMNSPPHRGQNFGPEGDPFGPAGDPATRSQRFWALLEEAKRLDEEKKLGKKRKLGNKQNRLVPMNSLLRRGENVDAPAPSRQGSAAAHPLPSTSMSSAGPLVPRQGPQGASAPPNPLDIGRDRPVSKSNARRVLQQPTPNSEAQIERRSVQWLQAEEDSHLSYEGMGSDMLMHPIFEAGELDEDDDQGVEFGRMEDALG
ncbi:hypothetical protein LTR08_003660 [Meristemomyces frigidus]|nr:hypothetical protein LTR08_003660 [Meristemomyces frigidus]